MRRPRDFRRYMMLLTLVTTPAMVSPKAARPAGWSEPSLLQLINDYRSWTLVNPRPYGMSAAVSVACAAPKRAQVSPHLDRGAYINVYVNEIGRAAMFDRAQVVFPVGTIIVKEKLADIGASNPELLTVMVKRSPGYNAELDDWEFCVLNGDATRIRAQGPLQTCVSCHKTATADYVFRPYLTTQH